MKSSLLAALLIAVVTVGCKPAADEANKPAEPAIPSTTAAQGAGGSGDGVKPLTSLPVGSAPVVGGENIGGSAGSVGAAAKDQAKRKAGGSSLDQMPADE